jgi:hypothetical protein
MSPILVSPAADGSPQKSQLLLREQLQRDARATSRIAHTLSAIMNARPRLLLLLIAAFVSLASIATAADRKFDMLAVAEQFPLQPSRQVDAPAHPSSYALIGGGFIEAGDPTAGEHPPAASTVTAALQDALTSAGYTLAPSGVTPTAALIYHWGLIRDERMPLRVPFQLEPNLRTRLSLVTPAARFPSIEERIISRRDYTPAALQTIEYPDVRDALDLARDGVYFVVVSAYDYAALARGETNLLWRTKLTAQLNSGALADVVHSLLRNAAPYLGRHLARRDSLKAPLSASPVASDTSPPPSLPKDLDTSHVATVLATERAEFSGQPLPK